MASDYFGQDKQVYDPGNIVGYNMVTVYLKNNENSNLCLAQDVGVQYGRNVTPQYELGSDSVWLVAGSASGSCTITRALGRKGSEGTGAFWSAFKPDDACTGTTITLTKGSGACGLDPGRLVMSNSMLQSMSSSISVGNLVITEQATYVVGKVSTSS